MTRDDVLTRVRGFISDNFLYMRPDFELTDDASLMGTGIVDSMGVMEVIQYLEDEFGVLVADEDITEANIGTPNAIASYVVDRLPAGDRQIA